MANMNTARLAREWSCANHMVAVRVRCPRGHRSRQWAHISHPDLAAKLRARRAAGYCEKCERVTMAGYVAQGKAWRRISRAESRRREIILHDKNRTGHLSTVDLENAEVALPLL